MGQCPHLNITCRVGQNGNQRTNTNEVCLDSQLIHAFNLMVNYWPCSLKFWNSFWLEIIIYQVDIFNQTHKTTAANFTCPPDHWTSIFTCPRAKFTWPWQSDLGFFLPWFFILCFHQHWHYWNVDKCRQYQVSILWMYNLYWYWFSSRVNSLIETETRGSHWEVIAAVSSVFVCKHDNGNFNGNITNLFLKQHGYMYFECIKEIQ